MISRALRPHPILRSNILVAAVSILLLGISHQGWSQDPAPAPEPAAEMTSDAPAAVDAPTTPAEAASAPTPAPAVEREPFVPEDFDPDPPAYEVYNIKDRTKAIWVDMTGETYSTPARAERILQQVDKAGFNTIYLVAVSGGYAMYPSAILPVSPLVDPEYPDAVQLFLDTATDNYPEMAVILVAMPLEGYRGRDVGTAPANNPLALNPNWLLVNSIGTGKHGDGTFTLDPAVAAVQDYCVSVVEEIAARYSGATGLQLHEIRYPGENADWGYSDQTVAMFNADTGESGKPSSEDIGWQGWRREKLNDLMRRLTNAVRESSGGKLKVSTTAVASGPPPASAASWEDSASYAGSLQDWKLWADEKLVDELVFLNFKSTQFDAGQFDAWNKVFREIAPEVDYVIGLGRAENFAEEVLNQIRQGLATDAKGVALFSYQQPNIEDIRSTLFAALRGSIFNEEYGGLRRSNIRVDPKFAHEVQRRRSVEGRMRDEIRVPEEFQKAPTLPPVATEGDTPDASMTGSAVAGNTGATGVSTATDGTTSATGSSSGLVTIYLDSGSFLRGSIMRETTSTITFREEAGFEITVDRSNVREIKREGE